MLLRFVAGFLVLGMTQAYAQVNVFNNGPMITHAGQGAGGFDVSMTSAENNVTGFNRRYFGPELDTFSVAEDFVLGADTLLSHVVLYGYETNANTPRWTQYRINLWQGQPGGGGSILASAASVSLSKTTIYRVNNGTANLLNTDRLINEIKADFSSVNLTAGTEYWVTSQVIGGSTGWANMVMDANPADPNNPITRAGNALQFRQDPNTLEFGWLPALTGGTVVNVEFPLDVYGTVVPEPASLLVLGTSVLALCRGRKRA